MTVLTVPIRPSQDAGLRPVPWRRMAWVTWRQHRPTLISVPAVLGAVAVFLWIAGLKIHHDYAVLTACHPASLNACGNLNSTFSSTDWTMANTILIFMNLAPAVIGAFAGGPVLARELETGTYRYAWTQGFGRERWTVAKLVLLAVAVTAAAGAFSQVFTWFFRPFLAQEDMTVLAGTVFDTRGIVFAAWTLAAFAIGAMRRHAHPPDRPGHGRHPGRLHRARAGDLAVPARALPASAGHQQPNSLPSGPFSVHDPWVLSTWYTGPGGKPANQSVVNQVLDLFPHNGPPMVKETLAQAFAQHGITQWWRYIPVSRFWPMQFVKAGWLLALSVLVMAATVWLVRRRAA